jgi:hypothetical protein
MRHILYSCVLLAGCALSIFPVSAQDRNALNPFPADGFQFTGTWSCEGELGNNKVHKSIYTGAVILGGKWLELTEQDIEPATGYQAKYLIGYNPLQKQLVEFDANNFGAAVYSNDSGWQKEVLVMTSPISRDAGATYVANRFVYTITAKNSFTVDWQISRTSDLKWVPADHLSCERKSQ